jgi:hypothetical protein
VGRNDRPLLPKNLQEPRHGLLDVFDVDHFAIQNVVGVDDTFSIEEYKDCLFGPGGIDASFDWAWLTLLKPLHQLLFVSGV